MPSRRLASLLLLTAGVAGFAWVTPSPAQEPMTVLPLWPTATPEPPMTAEPEKDVTTAKDNLISGHRSRRYTNVTKPTLSVYPPAAGVANTGAAAVVFPGGGYVRLAWDGEGVDTCKWLNSIGMTCLLVKYRVPYKTRYPENPADLEDAQQAIRLSRIHAAEWHIDPHRIGAVGYSAGAHLAVALSNHADDAHVLSTPAAKEVDPNISAHPDFAVVIYPGYLTAPPALATLDPAEVPTANTPPTFLLQAEDDPVHVENSLVYYRALKDAKVPAEMHLYPTGGHGFGVFPAGKPEAHWTDLATIWLHTAGVLK